MKKTYLFILACFILASCKTTKPNPRIEFEAADTYPEGVVYDKAANVYYVSSVRSGTIGKVTPGGTYSVLYSDSALKSTYGLKIFPDGKKLYACVSDANYSKYSTPDTKKKLMRLIVIDLASGAKVGDFDLQSLGGTEHFANDIAFDPQGDAFVTDSYSDRIIRVDQAGKATVFCENPLFKTEGVSLNGIVFHPSQYFLVASSGQGCIYKVSYLNPSLVQKVAIDGFYMGVDGMVLNDSNKLTIVVNGGSDHIYQLQSNDDWATAKMVAKTEATDRFAYPSTATLNGNDVWVMNAKFNELADTANLKSRKFSIQKAVLKPVSKK